MALALTVVIVLIVLLFGIGAAVALIAVLIAASFLIAAAHASPRPPESRLDAAAALRLWLGELLAAVKKNSRLVLNQRIGKIEEVLFETATYGRTSGNFALRVKAGGAPGSIKQVSVTGAEKNTLHGKVL